MAAVNPPGLADSVLSIPIMSAHHSMTVKMNQSSSTIASSTMGCNENCRVVPGSSHTITNSKYELVSDEEVSTSEGIPDTSKMSEDEVSYIKIKLFPINSGWVYVKYKKLES